MLQWVQHLNESMSSEREVKLQKELQHYTRHSGLEAVDVWDAGAASMYGSCGEDNAGLQARKGPASAFRASDWKWLDSFCTSRDARDTFVISIIKAYNISMELRLSNEQRSNA